MQKEPHVVTVWCHQCKEYADKLENAEEKIQNLLKLLDQGEDIVVNFETFETPKKTVVDAWLTSVRSIVWPLSENQIEAMRKFDGEI